MDTEIEIKKQLMNVLNEESEILDNILAVQKAVHSCVTDKNWTELESNLSKLQACSDHFVELEGSREQLCKEFEILGNPEFSNVVSAVRSKLNKSKIENRVLNEYITTARNFMQGIFDEVLPQRKNKLYSRYGNIVKPELQSIVLNQVV